MTQTYLLPIKTAALVFPLLALAVVLPVAIVLYRRYGVMSHGRTLSLFGGLYYLLTAVCMTIVPLPAASVDVCRRYAPMSHPALIPGHTFGDIAKEAHHHYGVAELTVGNSATAGVAFNLLLLLPLGVFLRYHFRRGPWATLAAGLALSLTFELTQGTGVWGLYPCPYRFFDVDDLLTNTGGALLGWLLAGPLTRRLPSLDLIDGKARARVPLPLGRRLVALLVDVCGFTVSTAVMLLVRGQFDAEERYVETTLATFAVWFVLVPWLTGATPGKCLLRVELVAIGGGRPPLWRLSVRALLVAAGTIPLWGLLSTAALVALENPRPGTLVSYGRAAKSGGGISLLESGAQHPREVVALLLIAGYIVLYALANFRRPGRPALHERLSGVRCAALAPTRGNADAVAAAPAVSDAVAGWSTRGRVAAVGGRGAAGLGHGVVPVPEPFDAGGDRPQEASLA